MMYPLNLLTPEPQSGGIRPSIMFIAYEYEADIMKAKSVTEALPAAVPQPFRSFALPMPEGGVVDSSQNTYGINNPTMAGSVSAISPFADMASYMGGAILDPKLTQVYQGTSPRSWDGTWQLIPESMLESAAIAVILMNIKIGGSPAKTSEDGKPGMLKQPFIYKIKFSNPIIDKAMQFHKMAMESYSISYFAQGYASTYIDMMPKHITLNMKFVEFGIKDRSDWM